jgi:uncharacterized OB-fold protein
MDARDAPMPVVDDIDTGGFWRAAARGAIELQYCNRCDQLLHLPKAYCHRCHSNDTGWRPVAPTGRLHAWTVVRQGLHPAFPAPYTIVLVALDDAPGARLVGHLEGVPALEVDMAMRATFEPVAEGIALVQWSPDLPA